VSTVRFAKVVEACGKPDVHLLLIDPAKDKPLQAAIKADRVMTLYQQSGGTDHGIVGFEQGRSRQFLVFPEPLKPFLGQRIVGIKYELLEGTSASKKETIKKEAVKPDQPPPTLVSKGGLAKPGETAPPKGEKLDQERPQAASEDNVVKFRIPERDQQAAVGGDDLKKLKRQVRKAMDALEQGKQVLAFNLLKRILDADTDL
jgi:hypothetical protein